MVLVFTSAVVDQVIYIEEIGLRQVISVIGASTLSLMILGPVWYWFLRPLYYLNVDRIGQRLPEEFGLFQGLSLTLLGVLFLLLSAFNISLLPHPTVLPIQVYTFGLLGILLLISGPLWFWILRPFTQTKK